MLINERKPLGTDPPLESDLLERELERGVVVEFEAASDTNSVQTLLGGIITAEEHVETHPANFGSDERVKRRGK
jgi:hypothetical protein